MRVLQVHCTYQYSGGEDSVVASEKALLEENGVIVEDLNFSNVGGALKKVIQALYNLQSYKLARKKIEQFKPDIIHVHNLHFAASSSVIFAIKKSGVPYVQTLHNYRLICPSGLLFHNGKLFLDSMHQKFPWSAVKAGVYRNSKLLTAWIALAIKMHQWMGTWKKASKYIVLTQHARQMFLDANIGISPDKLTVKPNFASSQYLPARTRSNTFLFIGRLSEEKGIGVMLKAFASLPYNLKIAGDGPLKDEVIEFCSRHQNIEYVGNLTREQVFPYLATGLALIFPSTWYEGMPMVLIEALASGLPVIASRIGAMQEMIVPGYNGLHFESGNAEGLRLAVMEFMSADDGTLKDYGANAYNSYIDNYTPEKNAKHLLGIYRQVIDASVTGMAIKSAYTPV
jgi:glycosyltransferase involved in cell wall biosynthesis